MSVRLDWVKSDRDWTWFIESKEADEKLNEALEKCPTCKKTMQDKKGITQENLATITHSDWVNLSVKELLQCSKFRCSSCYSSVSFALFPEKVADILEAVIETMKRRHLDVVNPRIKTSKDIKFGLMKVLDFAVSPSKGVEVICGECNKKNHFRIIDKENGLLQCLECGYYNKLSDTNK